MVICEATLMARRTIYLHPGYPKTGTTTLQRDAFPHICRANGWMYFGKTYGANGASTTSQSVRTFQHAILTGDFPLAAAALEPGLSDAIEDQTLFISNEEFIMKSFRDGFDGKRPVHRNYRMTISHFRDLFDDSNTLIRLILVLRRQSELVPSLYAQGYQHFYRYIPSLATPDRFVASLCSSSEYDALFLPLYFDRIVSTTREIFGDANVLILPFELLESDPDQFFSTISRWTGADCTVPTLETRNRRREGETWKTRDVNLLAKTRRIRRRARGFVPGSIRSTLRRLLRSIVIENSTTVTFDESMRRTIHRHFFDSNRKLINSVETKSEFSRYVADDT